MNLRSHSRPRARSRLANEGLGGVRDLNLQARQFFENRIRIEAVRRMAEPISPIETERESDRAQSRLSEAVGSTQVLTEPHLTSSLEPGRARPHPIGASVWLSVKHTGQPLWGAVTWGKPGAV